MYQFHNKKYFIFSGAGYIPTPKGIVGKRAVINVQNTDERCFLYVIASHMLYNTTRTTDAQENRNKYDAIISTLKCEGLTYPVSIKQVPKFEVLNSLCINIYTMGVNESAIRPLYISQRDQTQPINLLLIYDEEADNTHYTCITSMSRLLRNQPGHSFTYCPRCLTGFRVDHNGDERMKEHIQHCSKNKPTKIAYPTINKQNIKFTKISALMENALVQYYDFESYLKPENKTEGNITHMSELIVSGYCILPILKYGLENTNTGSIISKETNYTGPDAVNKFFQCLLQ